MSERYEVQASRAALRARPSAAAAAWAAACSSGVPDICEVGVPQVGQAPLPSRWIFRNASAAW